MINMIQNAKDQAASLAMAAPAASPANCVPAQPSPLGKVAERSEAG